METSRPVNILLVDDHEDNLLALNAVLRSPEYTLISASSGAQALEFLATHDFAVILLDVQMPGMDGLETARRVRKMERSANTPIILVTGIFPDEAHIRLGYEVGAVDFVSKPFDPRVMKFKVAVFAELFRKTEKIREQEKLLTEALGSRFRTLFEQSPLGIQLYDPIGACVQANRAWEKLWGERAAELKKINVLTDPEKIHAGLAIQKALGGEASELPEATCNGKWIKTFVYPVRNEQGAIREAAVIVQDVSQRKGAEEALRRSRDQLRIIFERVADGIIVHDLAFRVVYANDVGAQLLGGGSADEFVGRNAIEDAKSRFEILDQHGKPADLERLSTTLALKGLLNVPELTLRLKHRVTGANQWLVTTSRPVFDEAGKPYLAVTIYRDITEQRRMHDGDRFLADATAILASSLDRSVTLTGITELAVGQIADWCKIALLDEDGTLRKVAVMHSDPNLAPIAGENAGPYAPKAHADIESLAVLRTGKSLLLSDIDEKDLLGAAESPEHLEKLRKLGMRSLMIVPLRTRDRMLGTVALACASSGRHYDGVDLALAEELGRRIGMAIENSLLYREAQSQRERLQKAVQARDEFISIASHELKTPVTSLILHAEMAALQLQRNDSAEVLREKIQKYVTISTSQIDRLSRLIEDMLDASRIGNGKLSMEMEPFDLVRLVRGVVEDFAEQIRESGAVCELTAPLPVSLRGDRYRMEQVVTNLLTNAMKYGEGRAIRVSVGVEGGRAFLSVRDEGIGIAPENHRRIFERFERAVSASTVSGLGMGLYIVKKIVEAHGGEVRVESALGQGAAFTVLLPAG